MNHEVQTGAFDALIRRAGAEVGLAAPSLPEEELIREVGFVVNCRVALRLVERFDAPVSVELHPALAHDVEASVRFGQRYFAVCPERFLIKLPFTAAGCLATRQLSRCCTSKRCGIYNWYQRIRWYRPGFSNESSR